MKKIVFLFGIITLLANVSFAQEDKTVTLTVSGQGQTQDEAKQNALRNAIEQAFGTFISSNTEILACFHMQDLEPLEQFCQLWVQRI